MLRTLTSASIALTVSGVSLSGNNTRSRAVAGPNPEASRAADIAARAFCEGGPPRPAPVSGALSSSKRCGRGGGSTCGACSVFAMSRTGRVPCAAHIATQCAPGDQSTSFTRTPGSTDAAANTTPTPLTSTSNKRAVPSAVPASSHLPSGDTANRANGRPADAAPLAPAEAKAPSPVPAKDRPAPPRLWAPTPTLLPRSRRIVAPRPTLTSNVCVAAKNDTSMAAMRSAVVLANTLRSVGETLRHVIGSPSKSWHSLVGRTAAPAPLVPSTRCSRSMPSAKPTQSRMPVRSKPMAVAAVPGADATAASSCAPATPSSTSHSRTAPSRAPVASTPFSAGCHAAAYTSHACCATTTSEDDADAYDADESAAIPGTRHATHAPSADAVTTRVAGAAKSTVPSASPAPSLTPWGAHATSYTQDACPGNVTRATPDVVSNTRTTYIPPSRVTTATRRPMGSKHTSVASVVLVGRCGCVRAS